MSSRNFNIIFDKPSLYNGSTCIRISPSPPHIEKYLERKFQNQSHSFCFKCLNITPHKLFTNGHESPTWICLTCKN